MLSPAISYRSTKFQYILPKYGWVIAINSALPVKSNLKPLDQLQMSSLEGTSTWSASNFTGSVVPEDMMFTVPNAFSDTKRAWLKCSLVSPKGQFKYMFVFLACIDQASETCISTGEYHVIHVHLAFFCQLKNHTHMYCFELPINQWSTLYINSQRPHYCLKS